MDFAVTVACSVVGALLGVWVARRYGDRVGEWLPHEVWARRRVWLKVQRGEARLGDVGTFLQSSVRGWDFLVAHSATVAGYVSWWRNDEADGGDPWWPQDCTEFECEAVGAVVTWLRRDRDWGLLAACMEARLTPVELLAHVDGSAPVTLGQAQLLAALRSPAEAGES